MKLHARVFAAVAIVCVAATASAQDRRAPTIDDLLNLVQVSGAEISPDGRQVIYTRSELKKWSDNKRVSSIWIANADGTEHRQLLGSDKDRSPSWSPDGRYIVFLSTRDQAENARDAAGAQIWLLRTAGGEATKLTELETAVRAIRWSEDSTTIYFTAEEKDPLKAARKNSIGDGIFVDEGPNGQGRGSYSNVWMITVADRKTRQLTTGDNFIGDFQPSPDGTRVVYTRRPTNQRNQQHLSEVYVLDVATAGAVQLTKNEAPENNIAWAPDGKAVTYIAPSDKTWELAQGNLYIHPIEGGGAPTILSSKFPGDIGRYFWHPSSRAIVMSANLRGRGGVYELDLTTGNTKALTTGDLALSISSATKDLSRLAGTRSRPSEPGEIAVVDARGQTTVVTDANPWFKQVQVSQMRPMTWKSKDGLAIEGLLWLPASYKAGDTLPLILSIHGGPAGVWGTSFRGINHVYTSLGWAVLEPNVRGSTSYGDQLLRGNTKDIGGGDYWDAMTGVDTVIAQGIGDPNQLAVRGWSYGGILGGWTVTQTQRFKAASLGAMVADWASEYAMGFNHDVRLWYIGGTPWENPEGYRKQSSYTYIDKVTTPTLLLHGEEDDTCTIGQSMMFYQGLKDRGVTSRFIRFPREPHGLREPHHIRMRDVEEVSWLMKHTRGIDWKAENRKDEETKKPGTATTAPP
ncbi:MAG TPA: S9 family peptidase [Vicinamibacterales bacterium]|nr:S9 family peptidase [Vicinamibacterales bacterium]